MISGRKEQAKGPKPVLMMMMMMMMKYIGLEFSVFDDHGAADSIPGTILNFDLVWNGVHLTS